MGSRHHSRRKQQSKEAKSQVDQKYAVDERVLCYEPDQKKARVLYDSKVLEVVERKNHGKTKVEYKIHFFGWNSSWDRYVDEECVLKDTDENRTLQKELKEKADSLLQTHLKKRKRKKTLSELLKEATKDKGGKNANPSHSKTKTDEDSSRSHSNSESSDPETSDDDDDTEVSRIIVTNHMRAILERDCFNITAKKMLVRIPVDISVVCIFEAYVKDLGFRELRNVLEQREAYLKSNNSQHLPPTMSFFQATSAGGKFPMGKVQAKPSIEPWLEEINRIYRKVRQAQEIIYGLKTIFDYMLYVMLLYRVENDQFEASKTMRPKVPIVNSSLIIPRLPGIVQPILEPVRSEKQVPNTPIKKNEKTEGRRKVTDPVLTSKVSEEATPIAPTRSQSKALLPQNAEKLMNDTAIWHKKVEKFTRDLDSWRMLPEECFQQEEPDPSTLYGLIHLLRLFVKLPDILNRMLIPRRKCRIIAHHVNQMIEHIEACYVFSTKDLYFTTSAYEEDQMKVDAAKSDDEATQEVKVEVDNDKSMYSTRNHRVATNLKAKPQLAKIVEVPLSNTDGSLEEHRLTVSTDTTTIPMAKTDNEVRETSVPVALTEAITVEVQFEKADTVIKQEPTSPSAEKTKTQESTPRIESTKKAASRKPVIPLSPKHRQVRESAANAVAKNAHIFASQQNFSSRSSYSSSVIKREPKDKETVSVKRKLSTEEHSSPSKRITRTISKSSSNAGTSESKRMSQKQQTTHSPRTSPDRSKVNTDANHCKKRRISAANSSGIKFYPKKITSPRTSKTSSPHKVVGPVTKTPQKCTSSYTTAIRLRSKSGERQLRSKGSLVNALSLPMQTSQRSAKPSPQSPKRRQSLGTNYKDPHSPQSSSPPLKQTEPIRNLRSRR